MHICKTNRVRWGEGVKDESPITNEEKTGNLFHPYCLVGIITQKINTEKDSDI